ncbi:ABC transporter substrate-binding protein [Clostridium sp. Marseille-P2415]|uniref:ABC transporter substrate-binding protein n=1 Tax=Clostridium sp. Marseille-P2415 TaxID=1805471 RepID=UPI0009884AD3|nr:extracellular solute-binding protein [Clostridium sp. Marseille-P2415]
MKKSKKLAALGLVGAMAVSALSACSSGGDAGSTGSESKAGDTTAAAAETKKEASSGNKVKITVWTENRHDMEYMNKVVEEFNSTHDDVEIEYVVQTENYVNLITMAANSGQSPDIFSAVSSENFKNFAENGIIQPINDYITDDFKKVNEVDEHLFEGSNSLGDDIYWVPCGKRSGSRFIYNKEIFDKLDLELPARISDLPDLTRKITETGNGDYYGIIFPGASGPFERWIEHSAEMSGVTAYNYKEGKFDFSGYKPFIETVRQMFEEGSVFPGASSMKIDPVRVQFAEGHVALHANASQEATVLTEQFPAEIEWGVAQLPTLDGEIRGAEGCSINCGWMMSALTEHPKEAWEVIEYFGSEEVLKGYLEGGYSLPLSTYMDGKIDKSKIGRMADFSNVDYEAVLPVAPGVTPEGESYRDALWNACLPEGGSIDDTIAKLNRTYNDALDKEVKMGKTKRLVIKDYDPLHPNAGTAEYLAQ